MQLSTIVDALQLVSLTSNSQDTIEVEAGYASDLLSDVLGNAPKGAVWVTMQCHINVVAVASLLGLAAVIITGKGSPDEVTLRRAEENGVLMLRSRLGTFETVGRLYQLGVRGTLRYE